MTELESLLCNILKENCIPFSYDDNTITTELNGNDIQIRIGNTVSEKRKNIYIILTNGSMDLLKDATVIREENGNIKSFKLFLIMLQASNL